MEGKNLNVLICPDSFKGTLSAKAVAEAISAGVRKVWPDARLTIMPLADGGEGTLDALLVNGGQRFKQLVDGPQGTEIMAEWGILPDGTAVIEMATASGLTLVKPEENDLRIATSCGTGQLIRAAIVEGCTKFIIGIGGSATNDGGMGAMRALGARFLDEKGNELKTAVSLARLKRIDLSNFIDTKGMSITIATDVDSPLCGQEGATYVFGPQKGGTPEVLNELELAMRNYAHVLKETFGWNVAETPGAGSAGGMGSALLAFLKGKIKPGIDVVMNAAGFENAVDGSDIIITGEGKLDKQSLCGKTIAGVLKLAHGTPTIAICGQVDLTEKEWREWGLTGAWGLMNLQETADYAMTQPSVALERATTIALKGSTKWKENNLEGLF